MPDADPFPSATTLPFPRRSFPRHRTFALLGLTIRLESENDVLLNAAEMVLGSALPPVPQRQEVEPRVMLRHGAAAAVPAVTSRLEAGPDGADVLRFSGSGCVARVDIAAQTAVAALSTELLADEVRLRDVLHALVLTLLTRLDRQPLHAAALAVPGGGAGVVLAGPSGTGKSTLMHTALCAGMSVLADDTVFVQLHPHPRVWTLPGPLYLPPTAAVTHAQLRDAAPRQRAGGKSKIVIPYAAAEPPLERSVLCVLSRQPGQHDALLSQITVDDAVAEVMQALSPGFDVFRDSIEPRIRATAAAGAYRLRLAADPSLALPHLNTLLRAARQ